ncbi:MAG: hypothetical protein JWQ28_1690 [Pedobacter sp.]|jgi:hypothetical protein|nr:hypothetical protein [Pedobacter sp.]
MLDTIRTSKGGYCALELPEIDQGYYKLNVSYEN